MVSRHEIGLPIQKAQETGGLVSIVFYSRPSLQPATELCCRWLYYSLLDSGERRVARAMRDQVDTAIRAAAEEYC